MDDLEFGNKIKALRGDLSGMREFLKQPGHLDRLYDLAIKGAAIKPKRAPKAKPRSQLPDGFPDQPQIDRAKAFWALRGRMDLVGAIQDQADQFRDHHTGRGTLAADWPATWGTWMRNAPRMTRPPPGWEDKTGKSTETPEVWKWRVKAYREGHPDDNIAKGYWRADWGPLPGQPGCRAPTIN